MGLHYNVLTDDLTAQNYLALYISIKGYKDKDTGKRILPSAKESLLLMGIATNESDGKIVSNRGRKNEGR